MSNDYHNINIGGNGNVLGTGNTINSQHDEHHHHHHHHHSPRNNSSPPREPSKDAAGIGVSILFVALVICWQFTRNADEVYFYLYLALAISFCPFVCLGALNFQSGANNLKHQMPTIYGGCIGILSFAIAIYGQNNLDPQVIQLGVNTKDAFLFFKHLTVFGKYIVFGHLIGVIFISICAGLLILSGMFVLWSIAFNATYANSAAIRFLYSFRPHISNRICIFLLVMAWAFESDLVFQVIKSISVRG